MKLPLFIAHGQDVLQVLAAIVVLSNCVSVASVVVAVRKKKDTVSRIGVVLGTLGTVLGLWLCWLAQWEFDTRLLSIGIAAVLPISLLGVALSLWRKEPIQLPETTRGK